MSAVRDRIYYPLSRLPGVPPIGQASEEFLDVLLNFALHLFAVRCACFALFQFFLHDLQAGIFSPLRIKHVPLEGWFAHRVGDLAAQVLEVILVRDLLLLEDLREVFAHCQFRWPQRDINQRPAMQQSR